MPPKRPGCTEGVRTGSADFARIEPKSDCKLTPVRRIETVPESMLLSEVPVRLSEALATVLTPSGYRTRTSLART